VIVDKEVIGLALHVASHERGNRGRRGDRISPPRRGERERRGGWVSPGERQLRRCFVVGIN